MTGVQRVLFRSSSPSAFLRNCARDASQDPSPNSGWSEAAFAWLLEVQLGGVNVYGGLVKEKPVLGEPKRHLEPGAVRKSVSWLRRVMMVWVAIAALLYAIASSMT